jgi:hypothetical protein
VKRLLVRLGLVLSVAASTVGAAAGAQAHDSNYGSVFVWHLGDDYIGEAGFPTNSQATAANGDVITIKGTGAFSLGPRAASGGGTLVHHMAATGQDDTGTFQVRRLISFENYGSGADQGAPPNSFGGKLVMAVEATPDLTPWKHFPAVLTIYCELGTVPPGVMEGATLNVRNIINFDTIVHESGANIYLKIA